MKKSYQLLSLSLALCFLTTAALSQIRTLSGRKISANELDILISKQMDSLAMPGLSFAVLNRGKIVYHRTLGLANIATKEKVDANSIFEAASTSKTVFSYFVLKMVDKGMLHLDTPLYRYLPYKDIEKDDRYKLITARMALTHTTGFPNWRYFDRRDTSLYKYGELYLKFTPGTQFSYSGEGYLYLAKVIAHLNGLTIKSLDSLFQSEVAKPLGLKYAWFSGNKFISQHKTKGYTKGKLVNKAWPTSFPEQDSTWFGAAGGMHTEAVTYANFLQALMKGKGLSRKSLDELFRPQVPVPRDSPHYLENGNTDWGLGIAIRPVSYGTLYQHGGNNGNFQSAFMINRDNQNAYVFFTNCDQGNAFNKKISELMSRE